jgi:hypothetical protein
MRDSTGELTGHGYVEFESYEEAAQLISAFPASQGGRRSGTHEEEGVEGSWSLSERLRNGLEDSFGVDARGKIEEHLSDVQANVGCIAIALVGESQRQHSPPLDENRLWRLYHAFLNSGPVRFAVWPPSVCSDLIKSTQLRSQLTELLTESIGTMAPTADILAASMEMRQQQEKDFVRWNDTFDSWQKTQTWYLVDVHWMEEWRQFVTQSDAPLPGVIDNTRLLDSKGRPRPGLRPVDDYRGVNAAIWHFWQTRYGGGPPLLRRHVDIYSEPVRGDTMLMLVDTNEASGRRIYRL